MDLNIMRHQNMCTLISWSRISLTTRNYTLSSSPFRFSISFSSFSRKALSRTRSRSENLKWTTSSSQDLLERHLHLWYYRCFALLSVLSKVHIFEILEADSDAEIPEVLWRVPSWQHATTSFQGVSDWFHQDLRPSCDPLLCVSFLCFTLVIHWLLWNAW